MEEGKLHYGIIGLGSVGTVFAVMLKQAGYRVSVLEKDSDRVQMAKTGSFKVSGELKGEAGPFEIFSEVPQFIKQKTDVVLVCTKSCDSLDILKQIKGNSETRPPMFVSCQNGFDVEEQIQEVFSDKHALRVVLNLGCQIPSPREVRVLFNFVHYLSEKTGTLVSPERIGFDFINAGIKTKVLSEYRRESYKKAVLNSAMSSTCALTRMMMRPAMNDGQVSWVIKEIIREALQVAQILGLGIGEEFFDEAVVYLSKGGDHKPSMLVDIEKGRKTENEYLCGKIFRLAKEHNLQVPVIRAVYHLMHGLEKQHLSDTRP